MKHHQCFDACLLTEKLTIIASFYISVFSHYKSSRRASCSCIGCRWESATERVKERTARQLWRITVGEWSHWRNRADSVTRHFSLTFITWNFAYIKKCFQGFLLKKNNKLELLSRGLHMVRVMLERRLSWSECGGWAWKTWWQLAMKSAMWIGPDEINCDWPSSSDTRWMQVKIKTAKDEKHLN